MRYIVTLSTRADKQLSKLPLDVQDRIAKALRRIQIRPRAFLVRLVGSPFYRLRVGDYRVIIDLQEHRLVILVIEVGKREHIYDSGR
jgi:mRNA interferase RelE/StbE